MRARPEVNQIRSQRKNRLFIALALSLGLLPSLVFLIFLAGPRVEIDTTLRPLSLPEDLDDYLAVQEGTFLDLIPGTEKAIIWAGEPGEVTPLSIVYLHGFSASRQETAPLADMVAAELGANLFYTRFTGHGRTGEAMLEGSVNAWLNDTVEALKIGQRLGHQVVVIAASTAASAVTWMATQPIADNPMAMVLLSPNYGPADTRADMMLWPWGRQIAEFVVGPERILTPTSDLHATYWIQRYPTAALLPMMGLVRLARTADLERIHTPTLVIYSLEDKVVDPRRIEQTFERIGAEHKVLMPYSGSEDPDQHILAGDIRSPGSTQAVAGIILGFIRQVGGIPNTGDAESTR